MAEEKPTTAVATQPVKTNEITEQVLTRINEMQEGKQLQLPDNYSPANALKSAYLLMQDMDLTKYTPASIANALLKMVVQGLNPDKAQCYFVPYGNKLTLSRSYMGNLALARRLCQLTKVVANVVYEKDIFEFEPDSTTGEMRLVKHETALANIDDTKIVGAYCILTFATNHRHFELMTMQQIEKAWQQGATKGKSPAHTNFAGEMAKKSVINRALKLFINSSDDSNLYEEDEPLTTEQIVKEEVKENANKTPLAIDTDFEEVPKTGAAPAPGEQGNLLDEPPFGK